MKMTGKFLERYESFIRGQMMRDAAAAEKQRLHQIQPALTLSREAGARGRTFASKLADYLNEADRSATCGWAVLDKQLITKVVEEHKLPPEVEKYMREDRVNPVVEAVEEILNMHPSDWELFHYTVDTIRRLCCLGHVIIIGRGANFYTVDLPNVFHVRFVGSLEKRVAWMQDLRGMSAEEAKAHVLRTDRERKRFVKSNLEKKIDDPHAYNMVVNTDYVADDLLVRMLGDAFLDWAEETCPRAQGPMSAAPGA